MGSRLQQFLRHGPFEVEGNPLLAEDMQDGFRTEDIKSVDSTGDEECTEREL